MLNFSDPVCLQVALLSLGGVFVTAIIYRFVFGVARIIRLLTGILKLLAINARPRQTSSEEVNEIVTEALSE